MSADDWVSVQGAWSRGALHLAPTGTLGVDDALAYARGRRTDRLTLRQDSGSKRVDWVDTTFPPIIAVSQRLVEALREAAITGWTTYDVDIVDRQGAAIEGYDGLAIVGRSGPIDDARSVPVTKPAPSPKGKPHQVFVGLHIDEASWDGSDLFMPDGSTWICATGRAASVVRDAGATNVALPRLLEIERSAASLKVRA